MDTASHACFCSMIYGSNGEREEMRSQGRGIFEFILCPSFIRTTHMYSDIHLYVIHRTNHATAHAVYLFTLPKKLTRGGGL